MLCVPLRQPLCPLRCKISLSFFSRLTVAIALLEFMVEDTLEVELIPLQFATSMMNSLRLLLLFLLLLAGSACDGLTRASLDEQEPQATAQSPQPSVSNSPQLAAQLQPKNSVPTTTESPTPIRINLADLPKPFATNSASKSPNVVPIPPKPTLSVPQGFTVNVYAEGLDAPRWLALTPSGDVLVTETRQNRIRLLRDTNSD